ncbi:WD40 repeat domain-containing serine/threonine protein kinase [Nocardiopsis potens]|uniref:WD40 repeat domain-containing serine/threonine protein kinase n=1 Tax=Nocardiopsis potens TaxID=1246458 RepID=UPI000379601B|nr:serine/threonine-protein kinase [Nocardiopsis potens]
MRELDPEDPREIGGHRLLRRIGAGGMGVVYLGLAPQGGFSAVKAVRAEYAGDADFRARFRREAAAARRVRGPFTARVLGADPDAPLPWLATEYIPGLTLDRAVREVGEFQGEPLRILAAGLAEALAAIHAAGLVHRDLKPSNVLLSDRGPQVIDFGIARAADATALTATGQALGTPGYMSPEQVTGGGSGPHSDVFAFGGVLLYAATGRPPFGHGDPMAVLYRAVREEPDLTGLPASVAGLVRACLEKDPAARPGLAEVRAALAGPDGEPAAERAARAEWLPGAVTAEIARGAAEVRRAGEEGPDRGGRARSGVLRPLAWAGAGGLAVLAAAAIALASAADRGLPGAGGPGEYPGGDGGGAPGVLLGEAGAVEAEPVADDLAALECSGAYGPVEVYGLRWVGHGTELLALTDYGLSLFDADEGEETARLGGPGPDAGTECRRYGDGSAAVRRMDVSDDGRIAVQVAPEGDEILAWDVERREELPPIELSGALEDPAVALSGDGETVAVSGGAGGTARSLEVFRTEGGEPLLTEDSPYYAIDLDFDGGRLAAVDAAGERSVALIDTASGRVGERYPVREPAGDRASALVAFGGGDLLAYTTGASVVVWNPDTESVLSEFPYGPGAGAADGFGFTGDSTVALALSPGGSGAPGGLVRRWSIADGSEMSSLEGAGWRFPAFHPSAPDRAPEIAAFRTPDGTDPGRAVAIVRPEEGEDATRWLSWGPAGLGGQAAGFSTGKRRG